MPEDLCPHGVCGRRLRGGTAVPQTRITVTIRQIRAAGDGPPVQTCPLVRLLHGSGVVAECGSEGREMSHRQRWCSAGALYGVLIGTAVVVSAQSVERYSATAAIRTAGGAAATAPVTIEITRKMSPQEAERLAATLKSGGAPALRKALAGVAATGTITIAAGKPMPSRLTVERPTDKGRLLTIVTDTPLLFLGAGKPDAKPVTGYEFGVLDVVIDADGVGTGTLIPAAKITTREGAIVVEEYSGELVRLTAVRPIK
jgi:hypothetical protein